jgi:hypothetical protein
VRQRNTKSAPHVSREGLAIKGDCFAKANISAAQAAARQDAWFPRAHEDERRPQGACRSPQEGTPSAHPRVIRGAWISPARRDWCDGVISMPFIAPGSAARVPTSLFFFARTNCLTAASASASKRRWAARWCAIAFGGGFERSCAAIAWRYLQDGTSSYIRRTKRRMCRLQQ